MKNLLFTLIALLFVQGAYACSATAGFSNSNTSSGNNLLQITFTNSSSVTSLGSNQYAQYIVRFGDGSSSYVGYGGNVSHNYSSAGTYTATMIALGIDSPGNTIYCGDSTTASVTVSYPACGSTISVSYGSGGAVTYTANTPAGTSGMTYTWHYGDGTSGTGSPVTHTYSSNGYYWDTLVATSSAPCSWTTIVQVHVTNAAFTYSCSSAHASFTSSTSANTATFTNTSTNPTSSQSFTSNAYWYYGDGSNGYSNSHSYSSAGTYTVCLVMRWIDSISNTQFCYDSICHNVTVSAPPNNITGTVSFDTSAGCNVSSPAYKVWLITYNASSQILAAIDSVSGSSASYTFTGKPAGIYRVKAMVTNATSSPAPIPTYGLDSLHWDHADSFAYSGSGISAYHDIHLQCGTLTTGPGFIGGNVTMGANKGAKTTGVPDANVEILIRNAAGNIGYAFTDVNGNYSFSNLPVPGTYTIYPEILGYHNTPWIVTLTNSSQTASGINFQAHTVSHYTNTTTGIVNINAAENNIQVYPNPTTGIVNISSNVDAQAIISDVVGHKVYESAINAGLTKLNLSNLKAGMYFISIKSADLNYSSKIIIQH